MARFFVVAAPGFGVGRCCVRKDWHHAASKSDQGNDFPSKGSSGTALEVRTELQIPASGPIPAGASTSTSREVPQDAGSYKIKVGQAANVGKVWRFQLAGADFASGVYGAVGGSRTRESAPDEHDGRRLAPQVYAFKNWPLAVIQTNSTQLGVVGCVRAQSAPSVSRTYNSMSEPAAMLETVSCESKAT